MRAPGGAAVTWPPTASPSLRCTARRTSGAICSGMVRAGLTSGWPWLCDAAEEDYFRRALRRAGIGARDCRAAMEAVGFFVCTLDLEDELIRALGTGAVEGIIAAQGELRSLRTLQRQPAQRGRPAQDQLRRFMSGRSGSKRA